MAFTFMQLPKYENRSPLLDLSPINQAFGTIMQQRQIGVQNARADEQQRLERERFALQERDSNRVNAREEQMTPLKVEQLKQAIQLAKQQGATDAQLAPLRQAQMEAQTTLLKAQAQKSGQQSEIDTAIAGMIRNSMSPPQAGSGQTTPAQPQPQLQPQSFDGDVPNGAPPMPQRSGMAGDPNVILAQAAPQQQPPQAAPSVPMVETPLGKMPQDKARQLGFALGLAGKGDAGKMLADSANAGALGKEGANANDKRELDTTERLARLNDIAGSFNAKFLTLPEQLRQGVVSWKAYLGGKVTPEQAASRQEFVTFQANTLNNLNRYIQEITGAAMGVEEAKRITKSMPNMEDDPISFKAKLENTNREGKAAIARYRYLRKNGFNGQPWNGNVEDAARAIPLDKVPILYERRGAMIEQQLRQTRPGISPEQIRAETKAALQEEFGI